MKQNDDLTIQKAIRQACEVSDIVFKGIDINLAREKFYKYFGFYPVDTLIELYSAGIERIGDDVSGYPVLIPGRSSDITGELEIIEASIDSFRRNNICPILSDGCGNYHGVYLTSEDCCVYFFDSVSSLAVPQWVSASSIPRLVLAAAHASSSNEAWPSEPDEALIIDPYLMRCKRAPPIWMADI